MSNALAEAARRSGRDVAVNVTADPGAIAAADRIVLPGVGAFGACAAGLSAADGVAEALADAVRAKGRPFLGVCVGMQLMATRGLEHGTHAGLDWIPGEVAALAPDDASLKIPHMGWNRVEAARSHPVLDAAEEGSFVYFVHSFAFRPADPADEAWSCDYGGPFTAAAARDNLLGVQFHPEKSQAAGLKLLAAFLAWRP
ncbi:MAG: imidazole glycerol phosphate synthase subunit HisH [Caulobacterales bacterium]|nr:imidazole glycerol phosphate synthase subunit HisH [Caulobacterales bacterium]